VRVIVGIEFDIEQDEIPRILHKLENLAYELGCEQVWVYQDSGANLEIRGLVYPPAVFWTAKSEGEDGEDD